MPIVRVLAIGAAAALLAAVPASAAPRPDFDARGPAAAAPDRTLDAPGGALTGPSPGAPADVARSFLHDERASLGLDAQDVAALDLTRSVPLGRDAVNLHFADEQDGVPLFGADVRVAVGDDGRVLTVTGAPVPDADAPTLEPKLSAAAAVAVARADAGLSGGAGAADERGGPRRETRFAAGTTARLVRFPWGDASTIAWRVLLSDDAAGVLADYVIDGRFGTVLHRHSLVADATASTFGSWPGNAAGGTQSDEDFTPWLTATDRLLGNNAHTWTDIDADEIADPSEEVPPSSGADYRYPLTPVAAPGQACLAVVGCTWDSRVPDSWRLNVRQDATQVFALTNRMHDWLRDSSVAFTEAAGNFQTVNASGQGKGGDAVLAMASFGADTNAGLPASSYRNNANMGTPPDGRPPTMRMYMWTDPPRIDTHGGVDPTVVLHEYTHGLSNRLVVDSDGVSTLVGPQARAMGEGWSDWYALDYLVQHGFETENRGQPGSLANGPLISLIRTQPPDCGVGVADGRCLGGYDTGPGGYTYGDYGKVLSIGPEVHADGEIWTETLWDLRMRLEDDLGAGAGADRARSLITRAMQLSVSNPSFLDMRNAILRADATIYGGEDTGAIWEVFAHRGMGFFAATDDASDPEPHEDFTTPPAASGTLAGRVTTAAGEPAAGVVVRVDAGLSAVTGADGRYSLELPVGEYPRVVIGPALGLDAVVLPAVEVHDGATTTLDATTRKDWLASGGGATIASVSPGDYAEYGAGPRNAIDQRADTAWAGAGPDMPGQEGPKHLTVELPQAADLSELTIDPTPDIRMPGAGAIKDFTIETSSDGASFAEVARDRFALGDLGGPVPVALTGGTVRGVRFVRLTVLSTQGPPADSGGEFGMAEISAYGTPAVAPAPGPAPAPAPSPSPSPSRAPSPPAPSPSPVAPPLVAPAPGVAPAEPTAPRAALRVGAAASMRSVRRRGLPVRLRCATACRVRIVVRLPFAHDMVAGVARRNVAAGRTTGVRVRLRRGAVKRLAGRRSARVRVAVQLTGRDGGATRTLTRTVRLK